MILIRLVLFLLHAVSLVSAANSFQQVSGNNVAQNGRGEAGPDMTGTFQRKRAITTIVVTPTISSTTASTPPATFTPFAPIVAPQTASPAPSTVVVSSASDFSATTIVVIVVPICVGLMLIIFGVVVWRWRRARRSKSTKAKAADVESRPEPTKQQAVTTNKRNTMPEMIMKMAFGQETMPRAESRQEVKSFYQPAIRKSRAVSPPEDEPDMPSHERQRSQDSIPVPPLPVVRPRTSDSDRLAHLRSKSFGTLPNNRPRTASSERRKTSIVSKDDSSRSSSKSRKMDFEPGDYHDPSIRRGRAFSSAPTTRPVTRDEPLPTLLQLGGPRSRSTSRPRAEEAQAGFSNQNRGAGTATEEQPGPSTITALNVPDDRQTKPPPAKRVTANFSRPRARSEHSLSNRRPASSRRGTVAVPQPDEHGVRDAMPNNSRLTFF